MASIESFDDIAPGLPRSRGGTPVLRLGSGGLAALLAEQVASPPRHRRPARWPGMSAAGRAFLAIREYQLAPGRTMEELHAAVESGFMPIVKQVPGFLEYFLVEAGEGVISISVFTDQAGAEESTARAADWVHRPGRFLRWPADGGGRERLAAHGSAGHCPAPRRRSPHRNAHAPRGAASTVASAA